MVFFTYSRYIGVVTALAIVVCYLVASGTSVGSNFWLSEWSSDAHINRSTATSRRDLRLGVYGALGFAQGQLSQHCLDLKATWSVRGFLLQNHVNQYKL